MRIPRFRASILSRLTLLLNFKMTLCPPLILVPDLDLKEESIAEKEENPTRKIEIPNGALGLVT